METDPARLCAKDELWVCPHCGKHVEGDRYIFDDESCMINAIKVKKSACTFEDDNPDKRIIKVDQ